MGDDLTRAAGTEIDYVVTHLEMGSRPGYPVPPAPSGPQLAVIGAETPPADYFLYLYGQVGAGYEWTDWFNRPRDALEDFVASPAVRLSTLILDGWPGGFFMLDWREHGTCDLAYFGLVPQAVGRGLGKWLLGTAIHAGWDGLPDGAPVERMTVNTNTLDHPRALGLYQRMGFVPVRRETATRRLTRPRAGPGA